MTFEKWWETLTPQEHKVIGRTNAEYVWECATKAQREQDALQCELMGVEGYGTLAIAAAIRLDSGYTAV